MKQTDPQYKLRIPADLKYKIADAADENGRSMNAEIVARLEQSFVVDFAEDSELPEASALRSIATYAINDLKAEVWKAITQEIVKAAKLGFSEAWICYDDFDGFNVERPEHEVLAKEFEAELRRMGYKVKEDDLAQRVVSW